jgi:hypothetical protein
MSAKEEGVHQVLREPSSRPREPEQGAHRRAQVAKGALLPTEGRIVRHLIWRFKSCDDCWLSCIKSSFSVKCRVTATTSVL